MSLQLRHGQFFGTASRSVSAGGFQVDFRWADLPPEALEEHSHSAAHFILPLADGYCSLARDPLTDRSVFGAGSAIYNPPGVVHRDCFEVSGGAFLSVTAPADLPVALHHPVLLRGLAGSAMHRLVGLSLTGRAGEGLEIEGAAYVLAGAVAGAHIQSPHVPDWLVMAVEMANDLTPSAGLEIRAIAAEVGVHPVYLARAWRHHLGCSPGSTIRHRRAQHAAMHMTRKVSLAEAAASAGYSDQSHMTREFRRIFGVTPGTFRSAID